MPADLPLLSHLDASGRPHMVDVGAKADTDREATAEGWLRLSAAARAQLEPGANPKGDVLLIAQLAGIQGAKRAAELIPLCHPLPIDGVELRLELLPEGLRVVARVRTRWRTGVEMEALTAVSAALLTAYDMLKAVDRALCMDGLRLLSKRGGRSGDFVADAAPGVGLGGG
jgi:cyclic pyranopterin phosphate synthase